jgi:hypothetical protein
VKDCKGFIHNVSIFIPTIIITTILIVTVLLFGCAPGSFRWDQAESPGGMAGIWDGLWHGFVIGIFISMGWVVRIGARRRRWKRSQWSSIAEAVKNAMGEAVESLRREQRGWEDIPDRVEVRVRHVLEEWEQRHRST